MGILENPESSLRQATGDDDSDEENDDEEKESSSFRNSDHDNSHTDRSVTESSQQHSDDEGEENIPPPGKDPRILKWLSLSKGEDGDLVAELADLGFHDAHTAAVPSAESDSLEQAAEHHLSASIQGSKLQEMQKQLTLADGEVTGENKEANDDKEDLDDQLKDLSRINHEFRPFRNEDGLKHDNTYHQPQPEGSCFTPSIACSSIPPEVARHRIRSQAKRKQQAQKARRVRKGGEASLVTKQRRENSDDIKQSLDAVWY